MKNAFSCFFLFTLFCITGVVQAQDTNGSSVPFPANDAQTPCISPEQYLQLEQRCAHNAAELGLSAAPVENSLPMSLAWPLKAAAGFNDCSFYFISAYVDENPASGQITDYNCGTNTYDSHRGTDIAIFPYPFYKMDNNQVEVVAAAAGTILDKSDGNFDKNCGSNNLQANYIVLQHADGSRTNYWHMKKNSLTSKAIGQTVNAGEFLGVVGSSGNSSGPHLHFEVWSGNTVATLKDPYAGPCNNLNADSWWIAQKPYTEPAITMVSVNTTDINLPACPGTETLNESSCYAIPFQGAGLPAGFAKFYICIRNETTGMVADMSILKPDGSVFSSWTYSSNANSKVNIRAWSKALPSTTGTYTFKATYNGTVCMKTFDVVNALISPAGSISICEGSTGTLTAGAASAYLWNTGATTQTIHVTTAGDFTVTITAANGCTDASAPTTVTLKPAPVAQINANGPTVFCPGGSVQLTASAASAYAWSNGATTQSITVSNTGNYTVTVTNANGCTAASAPTSVTVNPLPTAQISANGPTVFCPGGSVQLTASAACAYAWNNGATTQSITVANAGNYTVTVTNANGCTAASAPTSVTVNPLPTAQISANGPTVFCPGGSVQLTASAASAYVWNNGATTQSITVSNTGNYTVTVTNANGCTAASTPTSVTVNPLPVAQINANGPTVFCPGGSVLLTASAASAYVWNTGATTQSITVSSTGNYTVTITNANACTAASAPVMTTQNLPLNGLNIQIQGDTLVSPYNSPNTWYLVGNANPLGTGIKYRCTQTGNYYVIGQDIHGCMASSAVSTVNCGASAVSEGTGGQAIQVFPNPVQEILYVHGTSVDNGNYSFPLLNYIGQILMTSSMQVQNNAVDLQYDVSRLPNGFYFLLVKKDGKTTLRTKVMVAH